MTWLKLSKEDREWLHALATPLVHTDREPSVARVYAAVDQAASSGNETARRVLAAFERCGCTELVVDLMKRDLGTIFVRSLGETVAVPVYRGARRRSPTGRKERGWQLTFWWELTRVQFDEHIEELVRQSRRLGTTAAALREVQRAWDQHPDAKTAGEVCTLLGIDPRAFAA